MMNVQKNTKTSYSNMVKKNLIQKTKLTKKTNFFPTEEEIEDLLNKTNQENLTIYERFNIKQLPNRENAQKLFLYEPEIVKNYTESFIINSIYKDNDIYIWKPFLNSIIGIRTTFNGIEIWYENTALNTLKEMEGQKLQIANKNVILPSQNKYSRLYWILLRYIPASTKEWIEILSYFENTLNTKILGVFQENIEDIGKTVNIKILFNTTKCPEGLFVDQKTIPINYIQTESMEQRIPIIHRTKKYNIHGKWEKLNSTQPSDKEPNEESNKEASIPFSSTNLERGKHNENMITKSNHTTVVNSQQSSEYNLIKRNSSINLQPPNSHNTVIQVNDESKTINDVTTVIDYSSPRQSITTPTEENKKEKIKDTSSYNNADFTTPKNPIKTRNMERLKVSNFIHNNRWEIFYDKDTDENPLISNNTIVVESTKTLTEKKQQIIKKQHKINQMKTNQNIDEILKEYQNSSVLDIESSITNFKKQLTTISIDFSY